MAKKPSDSRETSNSSDRTTPLGRLERAREDLLLFTGNLLAGRIGRSESAEFRSSCSFCGRPRETVKTLIEGQSFQICEGCVVEGAKLFSKDSRFDDSRRFALREALLSCSACRRTQIQVKGLFSGNGNGHRLCDDCLFACLSLLVEQGILLPDRATRARSERDGGRAAPPVMRVQMD